MTNDKYNTGEVAAGTKKNEDTVNVVKTRGSCLVRGGNVGNIGGKTKKDKPSTKAAGGSPKEQG